MKDILPDQRLGLWFQSPFEAQNLQEGVYDRRYRKQIKSKSRSWLLVCRFLSSTANLPTEITHFISGRCLGPLEAITQRLHVVLTHICGASRRLPYHNFVAHVCAITLPGLEARGYHSINETCAT